MAPLIVSIVAAGRAAERGTARRASLAMHSLLRLRPPTAHVVGNADDDGECSWRQKSVPAGAIVPRPTQRNRSPIGRDRRDRLVRRGQESMLTGEPLPVARGPGRRSEPSRRNGNSALVVEVTTIAAESVLVA